MKSRKSSGRDSPKPTPIRTAMYRKKSWRRTLSNVTVAPANLVISRLKASGRPTNQRTKRLRNPQKTRPNLPRISPAPKRTRNRLTPNRTCLQPPFNRDPVSPGINSRIWHVSLQHELGTTTGHSSDSFRNSFHPNAVVLNSPPGADSPQLRGPIFSPSAGTASD